MEWIMCTKKPFQQLLTPMVLAALILFALPTVLFAQDKALVWQDFSVDIHVQQDGTFDVYEYQTINFTSGTFTFGYREIPIQNLGYIDGWQITDGSGNTYQHASTGKTPYTFTVDNSGSSYVINWYFPGRANSTETYTLHYTVHDGLRYYEEGDQLWWKAIYGDRTFPVLDGHVKVTLPAPAQVMNWAAYINERDAKNDASATVAGDQQSVQFALGHRLAAGEEFEVRVNLRQMSLLERNQLGNIRLMRLQHSVRLNKPIVSAGAHGPLFYWAGWAFF
ncbi:MAG: DUF2207 domain-containing protein [Caldilineaceae bacterium]